MNQNLRPVVTIVTIAAFITGTALFCESGLTANNSGAPSMRTGSPGDTKSCTICHSGTAQNAAGIMSSNIPPTGYIPGSTYIIDAVCTDASKTRFGFEISPQNPTGAKLGVITITDVSRTKLVGSGKYITHTAAGTSGAGTISWSFHWTAPPVGSGDVTFYGAFNYSNHNNASSGDVIMLDRLTVSEDISTGIGPDFLTDEINFYPNPVGDVAHILIPGSNHINEIRVYNTTGVLIRIIDNESLAKQTEIDVATLASGTYYVSFATTTGYYTRKMIKL